MNATLSLTALGAAVIFLVIHIIAPRVPLWIATLFLCIALGAFKH